ncbi:MAG TPA: ATP-binding protein [Caldilineaceae bacterium]|nr:ATP-binding protein [Caldilineaceae bacterium]
MVSSPATKLSDWLLAAKHRSFVGRTEELALGRRWFLSDEPPFSLLYIFAPGGVGKTTLLHEYAHLAAQSGLRVLWVDGRSTPQPSPQGFFQALHQAGGPGLPEDLDHCVLLVDTFELLTPLHSWFQEHFLPGLSRHCRVVVAGRTPPNPDWQTDLAWREVVQIISLRNLRPDESQALLTRLGVPPEHHATALACTHGHPLALVLVADLLKQRPADDPFDLARAPDVVRVLVERFARDIPTAKHRRALEICAHARVTTEALLSDVLGPEEGRAAFAWLRGLSFIEHAPDGLFPHDLVRDALEADLRWRNFDDYRQMHRQVRQHIVRHLLDSSGIEQQRAFFDLLYMHRRQPLMQPYYEWKSMGSVYAEPATTHDHPAILEMVQRHEGPESAQIAAYWLQRQPQAFMVIRSAARTGPAGFIANLLLHTVDPEDEAADPAIRAAWAYVRRYGPLRAGECILHHRFWMSSASYQDVATHNLVSGVAVGLYFATAHLAWAFPSGTHPEFWEPLFAYINFRRAPEADFEVGGRRYGVFAHDWRVEPPHLWLEVMGERELDLELKLEPLVSPAPAPLLVLSQPEFVEAVRHALRDINRPGALAANPLLRSRVLHDHAGPTPGPEALQSLLRAAAKSLTTTPKDEKLYRALYHTFLQPAPTQEAAAELLDLPFSTYRYHLGKAIERVANWLWQRELHGYPANGESAGQSGS